MIFFFSYHMTFHDQIMCKLLVHKFFKGRDSESIVGGSRGVLGRTWREGVPSQPFMNIRRYS